MSELTIVTVTYNSAGVIAGLLDSLPADVAAIVVDNGSTDETTRIVAGYNGVRLIRNRNTGYGRAANLGFLQTQSPYVMLVNPDVVLGKDTIGEMLACMRSRPDIGIVGARMFQRQPGGRGAKTYAVSPPFSADGLAYTGWIVGALMLIRREALQQVGMFDENIFLFFEETDLCVRFANAGYKLAIVESAEAEHTEASSSTPSLSVQKIKAWHAGWSKAYYYRKHFSRAMYVRKASGKMLGSLVRVLRSVAVGDGRGVVQHYYELNGALAACLGVAAFNDGVGRLT